MPHKRLALILVFSLFFNAFIQTQSDMNADGGLLSLNQIDELIDKSSYNEALKALAKYIETYPDDFDRAQYRISKILNMREKFNAGASSLVEGIRSGEDSRVDKLGQITELESSELNANENVVEFTNLARRTVTMGEVLFQYNRIMREGIELIRKEKFSDAALKFEEGFTIKNESSDLVFEVTELDEETEGTLVVYESDITEPVKKAVSDVKNHISGSLFSDSMNSLINDCEKAYSEYIRALSSKNIESVKKALKNVDSAFSNFARLRNKIMDSARVLVDCDRLANERNPLLSGISYISFYQKFVLGDPVNPDTGIIAAFDAYYNTRIESMKSKTNDYVFSLLDGLISKLPESKIYSLSSKINTEIHNVDSAKDYAAFGCQVHDLYEKIMNFDGTSLGSLHPGYKSSMSFVNDYISALALSYSSVIELSEAKSNTGKVDKGDLSETSIDFKLKKLSEYEKIKSDSASYLSLIDEELTKQKNYFDEKMKRENEIAELMELSDGKLNIIPANKRNTAGVQISDDPIDFRKEISYFSSICNMNYSEASLNAQKFWGYMAYAYSSLAEKSYDYYDGKCLEIENLFTGEKKYPIEAKENAEKLNVEIAEKKENLIQWQKMLAGGEEYKLVENEYNMGCIKLEQIIEMFGALRARNIASIEKAKPLILDYENLLRSANEKYERALSEFKKEKYEEAAATVEAAAEEFARALDLEYSEKIRLMRESTLGDLAIKIQEAEYEKILREVYNLKEQATSYYYASNFDAAENSLVLAQTRWAKVSVDSDPEIEDLLNVIRTVKSLSYGRVLLQSDPHYPELSYSLDMAKQSYERGLQFKKEGDMENAKNAFSIALTNVRNVQNVYPLNKEARLIALKIARELDPDGFSKLFENQYNAAKMNSNKNERLAEFEDLYAINPEFKVLADEIYKLKDSLGMFPKKTVEKSVKKDAEDKISQARKIFRAAGNDNEKLSQALSLINEAISLDGSNKKAKALKLDIQLKIGSSSVVILSQNEERLYSEAARLFNQRRFAEAKEIMDDLMKSSSAKRSRKVIDLNNRLLKRL